MIKYLLRKFDCDTPHRVQALFCNVFILQNRLQTACEKIQTDISMKQWLLLAMLEQCPEPRTLTNVGKLMGCSRQNVKKLAAALEKKGYLTMTENGNSVCLSETGKIAEYAVQMDERRGAVLKLLFSEFEEAEIAQFYSLYAKLYVGMEQVEEYTKALEGEGEK